MAHLTPQELADLAEAVARGNPDIDTALASLDEDDEYSRTNLQPLVHYCMQWNERVARRIKQGPAQKRAYAILRSLLTPEQRAQLARSREFIVTLPSGNSYRLHPNTGGVALVERHGSRWYMLGSFCYHDPGRQLPPADVSITHLLTLLSDELRFLAEANWSRSDMWRVGLAAERAEARRQYERDMRNELAAEGVDADRLYAALEARYGRGEPAPYLDELEARDRAGGRDAMAIPVAAATIMVEFDATGADPMPVLEAAAAHERGEPAILLDVLEDQRGFDPDHVLGQLADVIRQHYTGQVA